jgi:methylenetetrahydrofolate reductase (NADPH)
MSIEALTSAEISLPERPNAGLVRERIATLAKHVDLVGLTDNHAGQPRMSPLAAVALAREQGVATVVHVSCRDRNRLALRSQVVGAAALGCDGVLCLYGDPVPDVPRVRDYTTTRLLAEAKSWVEPYELALGCVVDPFAVDLESELALLGRKIAAGADFAQTQMVLEPGRLAGFLDRAAEAGKLGDCRIHASVPVIRTRRLADILNASLPFELPKRAYNRIASGGGIEMAIETAIALAELPQVDALHVMAWGSEGAAGKVAAAFRAARGAPVERPAPGSS